MLFLAVMFCAVFMPCLAVMGVIFLRPSDNPFARIIGRYTLGMAVFANALGQMVFGPESQTRSVLVQLFAGVTLIVISLFGLPDANRSLNALADATLREAERVESELHRNSRL